MTQNSIDGIKKPDRPINKLTNKEPEKLNIISKFNRLSEPVINYVKSSPRIILGSGIVIIVVALSATIYINQRSNTVYNAIPLSVRDGVSFQIYYPEQSKLPAGYTFNLNSFTHPTNEVLVFSVNYPVNNKIIFSEQAEPSSSQIQNFYANYMPLRNSYQTAEGQAEIGAYKNTGGNLQTLVSLPTNGTWLIITAPPDITQNQLKQVLSAITK